MRKIARGERRGKGRRGGTLCWELVARALARWSSVALGARGSLLTRPSAPTPSPRPMYPFRARSHETVVDRLHALGGAGFDFETVIAPAQTIRRALKRMLVREMHGRRAALGLPQRLSDLFWAVLAGPHPLSSFAPFGASWPAPIVPPFRESRWSRIRGADQNLKTGNQSEVTARLRKRRRADFEDAITTIPIARSAKLGGSGTTVTISRSTTPLNCDTGPMLLKSTAR